MTTNRIQRLFIHTPEPESVHWDAKAAGADKTALSKRPATAVFITPESLANFPIASIAVGLLSAVTRLLWPSLGREIAVVVWSLFVGGLILINIDFPATRPKGLIRWVVAVAVGLINSIFLAASVLGVADRFYPNK